MSFMKNILVTGASGFIGQALCKELLNRKYKITTELSQGIDVIIHLAARVHVMKETNPDPLVVFRKANVEVTKNLAEQAVKYGVKRFVFVSSIHVNGNNSDSKPFQETDQPSPESPYAISKLEAEQCLYKIAQETDLEVVVIRPPLVYGPHVKANFLRLLRLVEKGFPLPLGAVKSKRSFISIKNLVDFLIFCVEHSKVSNELFLISDDEDLSTPELIGLLAQLFGKFPRLFSMPPGLLYNIGRLFGKMDTVDRLCGSLQLNISKAKQLLDWKPAQSVYDGLEATVRWYKKEKISS
jgi:UDP-glucose 4-epimerase